MTATPNPHDRRVPGAGPEADVRDIIESYVPRGGCVECEIDGPTVDAPAVTVAVFDYLRDNELLREGL